MSHRVLGSHDVRAIMATIESERDRIDWTDVIATIQALESLKREAKQMLEWHGEFKNGSVEDEAAFDLDCKALKAAIG